MKTAIGLKMTSCPMVTISQDEKFPDGFQNVIIEMVTLPTKATGRNSNRNSLCVLWPSVRVESSANHITLSP